MTDEQLATRAQTGDAQALDELVRRLYDDVIAVARKTGYFMRGGDRDDVDQEALVGLMRALKWWKPGPDREFKAFALMCVRRHLVSYVVKQPNVLQRGPLDHSVRHGIGEEGDELAITELLADPGPDIVEVLALQQELRDLAEEVARLTPLERRAVLGFAYGYTYAEIEGCDDGDVKQIDNAIQRARDKLRFAARLRDAA